MKTLGLRIVSRIGRLAAITTTIRWTIIMTDRLTPEKIEEALGKGCFVHVWDEDWDTLKLANGANVIVRPGDKVIFQHDPAKDSEDTDRADNQNWYRPIFVQQKPLH